MREKLIYVIFEAWVNGYFGTNKKPGYVLESAIREMNQRFVKNKKDEVFIESQLTLVACTHEAEAFKEGMRLAFQLFSGQIQEGE